MSTKRVCDMSCGAMHEFALALDRAKFDASLIHRIINAPSNTLAQAMYAAVTGDLPDARFEMLNSFEIEVPEGYDHATRLDAFALEHRNEFFFYNDAITDQNFGSPTIRLEPGRKLKVTVFEIKKTVSSEDCFAFLKGQEALLVGAQGASLVYEQKKEKLPVGKWSLSFDEKDRLWIDSDGRHRVPRVCRCSDGDYQFGLGYYGRDWPSGRCLLCFSDASA
jgi:hypothetical protein